MIIIGLMLEEVALGLDGCRFDFMRYQMVPFLFCLKIGGGGDEVSERTK